jgi:hypothetical protein
MKTFPHCVHCSHINVEYRAGHDTPCPNPECANQMRETDTQALCAHRANHAAYTTPAMKAMGLQLIRCDCGLKRAARIRAEEN